MTNPTKTHTVTLETPVSIRIGSDTYAARVVKVTPQSVTTAYTRDGEEMTFRLNKFGSLRSGSYALAVGYSETRLDPGF